MAHSGAAGENPGCSEEEQHEKSDMKPAGSRKREPVLMKWGTATAAAGCSVMKEERAAVCVFSCFYVKGKGQPATLHGTEAGKREPACFTGTALRCA
ncbi:hypothetical protein BRYFOR_09268 [Marvinbryantia formatexigens DSM 14469]|uniref:Uncharacterized protein n=1 Tax=Marvinbryantia formatexigens DSM 14469 TaxID=478749 RepID=C6LKS1_9FIRM|nr:hypothetical protein BRYFOR_09268 [Marvinbryantia formatexigens DSM 14469]